MMEDRKKKQGGKKGEEKVRRQTNERIETKKMNKSRERKRQKTPGRKVEPPAD